MTASSNSFPAHILQELGLAAERQAFPADVQEAFAANALPLLSHLGIPCELAETFSARKRCTSVVVDGRRYIVFDHALLDCFERFDWLNDQPPNAGLAAAALQRPLAEAARTAQHVELYAFFVRRALEVEPLFRQARRREDAAFARFWQASFVLCHEVAHALPHDHPTRQSLDARAVASVSSLTNELILGLTGQLTDMLANASGEPNASLRRDVDAWLATKDDLNLGDDAIFATYEAVGTDPRFLDEVACDSFAVTGLVRSVVAQRATLATESFAQLALNAMAAAYRGFLHHRLVSYFDDALRQLPSHLAAEHIDPLKLRLIVEMSLRSNLVVLQMLDAARELAGERAADTLRGDFGSVQALHMNNLFEVCDKLISMTVLDEQFHKSVPAMLAEGGLDLKEIDEDPLSVFLRTDSLWQELVGV